MRKSRIILLAVIVLVLGGIASGIFLYIRRNTGSRPLIRAEVALTAGNFEKAAELARQYITARPGDWRGPQLLGRAHLRLGRYDDARKAFAAAAKLAPDKVEPLLARADTYSLPAGRVLARLSERTSKGGSAKVLGEEIVRAIDQLHQANSSLKEIKTDKGDLALDIRQRIGMNYRAIAMGWQREQARLEAEVKIAEASRLLDRAATMRGERDEAGEDAAEAAGEAIRELLAVVRQDTSRTVAARALVDTCRAHRDKKHLPEILKVIMGVPDKLPIAAMRLEQYRLGLRAKDEPREHSQRLWREFADMLDGLLAENPKETEILLARGEAALELDDPATARRFRDRIGASGAKDDSVKFRARLLEARIIMREQAAKALSDRDYSQAIAILVGVTGEHPGWPDGHYYYGLAADAASKVGGPDSKTARQKELKEVARREMRRVVEISPGDFRARGFLVRSLIDDGFGAQALDDARECCEQHPQSPVAIRMLFTAAMSTDPPQSELARQTLSDAENFWEEAKPGVPRRRKKSTDPRVLREVVLGYRFLARWYRDQAAKLKPLEDKDQIASLTRQAEAMEAAARTALRNAADCEIKKETATAADRLAVARSMLELGRTAEAEKVLLADSAGTDDMPEFHFVLGQVYRRSGQVLRAIEQYRSAIGHKGEEARYRLALARTLFDSGDLASAQAALERIDASNVAAAMLRLQIRLARGESVPAEETLKQFSGDNRGLALVYYNRGDLEQCKKVCLAELPVDGDNSKKDDPALRLLLAQTYKRLGEMDKCLQELKKVVEAVPDQMPAYVQYASALLIDVKSAELEKKLPEVERALGQLKGARAEMVDLTMGGLFTRIGDFKSAVAVYDRLIARSGAPAFYRYSARLLRARALARDGQLDSAVGELDALAKVDGWTDRAISEKAGLLVLAGRTADAAAALGQLRTIFAQRKDPAGLLRVGGICFRLKATDMVLGICEQVKQLMPQDPAPYGLQASALMITGRPEEAVAALRKAVSLQPSDPNIGVALAQVLDALHRPRHVLDALDRVEQTGRAGQAAALFQRGRMLATWGLPGPSADALRRLAKSGHSNLPGIQLALGRSLAQLGQLDEAREQLIRISEHSPQYVAARQLLAANASSDDAKIKALDSLNRTKPGRSDVLVQRMTALQAGGKADKAIEAFDAFMKGKINERNRLTRAHFLALICMAEVGDFKKASELARGLAEGNPQPYWSRIGALVSIDVDPAGAAKLLPEIDKADLHDVLLGLALAVKRDDAAGARSWADQMDRLVVRTALAEPKREVPARYLLLAALAVGRVDKAREALSAFDKSTAFDRTAASELVNSASGDARTSAEAVALIKSLLAGDLGLRALGAKWAMQVLAARPQCQWAATMAFRTDTDPETRRKILETVRPADCAVARIVQASLLGADRKFVAAGEIYRGLAEQHKGDIGILLARAASVEKAGQLKQALELYREIQRDYPHPVAANNGAYIVTQINANDPKRLAEAYEWMDRTVEAHPTVGAYRETRGWLAFLLGKKTRAQTDIRQAIKGLTNSPDAHYHLGVVEADAGDLEMARWHYEAAISSITVMTNRGQTLAQSEKKAAELAKDALAELDKGDAAGKADEPGAIDKKGDPR